MHLFMNSFNNIIGKEYWFVGYKNVIFQVSVLFMILIIPEKFKFVFSGKAFDRIFLTVCV